MFLLARIIGPAELGIAAISTFPAMVVIAALRPVADCVFREHEQARRLINAYFVFAFAAGLAGSLAALGWGWLASSQTGGESIFLAWWSVPAILFASLGVAADGLLLAEGRFRAGAARRIVGSILGGAVALVMAVKGFGAASFAGYLLVSNGTGSLAATIISRWLPSPRTDRLSLRRAGAIAAPLIMSTIVLQASARFLEIIAGFQLGNKAAGHARIATQIAESVSSILFPSLDTYVIAKGNATGARLRDAQRRIYEQMLLTAPFVSVFLFSAVAAAVPTFVLLVLGPDWYPAIVPAMILCCIGLPYSLDMPMRALLKSRGDMTPVLRIVLLSSSATAVLVALGAAVSLTLAATGAVGAAAVAAAYSTRAAVAGLGVSRRDIANAALRCFLCLSLALASSLLVLWLLPPDPSRLLAIFAGGALTVLLSAIAVGTVVPKASPLRMILSGLVRRANY